MYKIVKLVSTKHTRGFSNINSAKLLNDKM